MKKITLFLMLGIFNSIALANTHLSDLDGTIHLQSYSCTVLDKNGTLTRETILATTEEMAVITATSNFIYKLDLFVGTTPTIEEVRSDSIFSNAVQSVNCIK